MKPEPIAEKVSLDQFIYGKYLDKHNLAVVKVEWIEDKSTGLIKPHVWTQKKQNERNPDEEKITK